MIDQGFDSHTAEVKQDFIYCTYIIESLTGWCYCGITGKLVERILAHNKGKSISTRRNKPYVLRWVHESTSRTRARFIEKQIKNIGVRTFLQKSKYETSRRVNQKLLEGYQHEIIRSIR